MPTDNGREKMRLADHDLLIKLDVKVSDIGTDVKELKDGINTRVTNLEKRVDTLESFQNRVMGVGAVIMIFIGGFASWVWSKLTK